MAEVRPIQICRNAKQGSEPGKTILFHRRIAEYDQLNAVETLGMFNHFLIDVVAQYEGNERMKTECEQKSQDLLHYIELHDDTWLRMKSGATWTTLMRGISVTLTLIVRQTS